MTSIEALDILVGIAGYHAQYLDKEEIKEYNEALSHYEDLTNDLELLEKHKQIEKELGIDLITLFSQKYERSDDLEVEDKKTIYFVRVIMDIGQKKNGLILSKK